jgi:uncharacterized protein
MRNFFVDEPYHWLQCCFFQPVRFEQEFELRALSSRLKMLLRLVPLLFLYSFSPAIIVRLFLASLQPDLYPQYGIHLLVPLSVSTAFFLFDALWVAALCCVGGVLVGGIFSFRFGIALALGLSVANAIIVHTTNDVFVGIIFGLAFGLILGIAFNSGNAVTHGGVFNVTTTIVFGIVGGLLIGGFTGIVPAYWAGFELGTLYPALQNTTNIWGSTVGLIVGGIAAYILAMLFALLLRWKTRRSPAALFGIRAGIVVACAFGLTIGIPVGDAGVSYLSFTSAVWAGLQEEVIVGMAFLFCYFISYYRLPLYPISAYSMIQANVASRSRRYPALYCLQNASLHWDECVFLPLPYVKEMLLLAAEQSLNATLDEVSFIVLERPQQIGAAQDAIYEIVLLDLEERKVLRDIGLAHQRLAVLLLAEVRASNSKAEKVFRILEYASHEAASYQAQTNKDDRRKALERMVNLLKEIPITEAFRSIELCQLLKTVIMQWSMLAEQGMETLGSVTGKFYLENPYAPGNALDLRDPLFVGRNDIVQKLGNALQRKYRPTFLLTGERRMGKSSILKQLPVLLGARYLSVFYDLQRPGMLASISAFLAAVALGIARQCDDVGLPVHALERARLDEALQQSESTVYDIFDQWLLGVEEVLVQADRIVILTFDEFEKLEEASNRDSIKLNILFDFFRSMIQNRTRFALLFSGAKMIGDMGRSWAGYFVNVERVKVSFLQEEDARLLITNPVPSVFSAELVQEIIQITHGQPFLVQAVCKQIIERLNDQSRAQATLQDVIKAIEEIFEVWTGYFWDLWDRCDYNQRLCLLSLLTLEDSSIELLAEKSSLSVLHTRQALDKLWMRDLVIDDHGIQKIAIPLVGQWIQQNQHLLALDGA